MALLQFKIEFFEHFAGINFRGQGLVDDFAGTYFRGRGLPRHNMSSILPSLLSLNDAFRTKTNINLLNIFQRISKLSVLLKIGHFRKTFRGW